MDGLRISELARRVGVPTSTVRYYERIGLVPGPARSSSGYRIYDADAATRLLFITRAKRLGLSLEAITELVGIWVRGLLGGRFGDSTAVLPAKVIQECELSMDHQRTFVRKKEYFRRLKQIVKAEVL